MTNNSQITSAQHSTSASAPISITPPQPTLRNPPAATGEITDLLSLMARLRTDCPWDIKQTNHSLIPYAIEEVYELIEAIQADYADGHIDDEDIKGELGDVLLQVVFHCQLYAEQGRFGLAEVIENLQQKLIRRHPHVFDKKNLPDEEAVKQRWDEIKAEENAEKIARGKHISQLDKVKAGSALMQAQGLQKHASKLGFDWDDVADALDKLEEEVAELKAILPKGGSKPSETEKQALEKELGDCIFGVVNVARKLNIDAETATLTCVHKFRSRFAFIEQTLATQGKTIENSTLAEMDELWELAKNFEK